MALILLSNMLKYSLKCNVCRGHELTSFSLFSQEIIQQKKELESSLQTLTYNYQLIWVGHAWYPLYSILTETSHNSLCQEQVYFTFLKLCNYSSSKIQHIVLKTVHESICIPAFRTTTTAPRRGCSLHLLQWSSMVSRRVVIGAEMPEEWNPWAICSCFLAGFTVSTPHW